MNYESSLEPVPKSDLPASYIYPVTNQPGLIPINNQVPWNRDTYTDPVSKEVYVPSKRLSIFVRWPALLFYGLCIAIIAGIIGGFLGKSITTQRISNSTIANSTSSEHCNATSSNPENSSALPSPLSTPTSLAGARLIPIPTTGCTPPTTQRTFKSTTVHFDAPYNTYCATGWLNDELFAMSAATASDCVEACIMYNGHKQSQDRTCVGGGFIPEWWNQSKAMQESGGMPYNCFLKSNDSGTGRNNKDVEVVSLCLPGACGDVLGGKS